MLTPDMAYVINGGDTPTTSFQKFTDLCCTAYNELRSNSNLFINLLELVHTYMCVHVWVCMQECLTWGAVREITLLIATL